MIEIVRCVDGKMAEINDDYWRVPLSGARYGQSQRYVNVDWSVFPEQHRRSLMALGRLALEHKRPAVTAIGYEALTWLYRYLQQIGKPSVFFSELSETEWGAFAEWVEQDGMGGGGLSLATCRTFFSMLKTFVGLGLDFRVPGITEDDLETLQEASKRRFRDANRLSMARAARRALSEAEAENLYSILRAEWWAWRGWSVEQMGDPPDLLATVAAWLAWDEGLRPEEINALTVNDVHFGERNRLWVHAPNKLPGWVEIGETSVAMLKAVLEWGESSRTYLDTDRLWVEPLPHQRSIGSQQMTRRLRLMLEKYGEKYPLERPDLILADGRKTLGAALAAHASRERVRVILRHRSDETMNVYYVRQGNVDLSRNLARALRMHAIRLSMAYNAAVVDPRSELPGMARVFERNPGFDQNPYGACILDASAVGGCRKGTHCGRCELLVPMASKRENWVTERDLYITKAQEADGERARENRIAHAAMCQAYIDLIDARLEQAKAGGVSA